MISSSSRVPKGLQGGADFMMAFSNKPAAQALVAYLTSAVGGQNWASSQFQPVAQ